MLFGTALVHGNTYIVMSMMGSTPMLSEESNAFSTSSRTVVYKHFPGCRARGCVPERSDLSVNLNGQHYLNLAP